jgi:hypothetical protein
MTLSDMLKARSLDEKERLRRLESLIDDIFKASRQLNTEFSSEEYLAHAADLRTQASRCRERIARLEKLRLEFNREIVFAITRSHDRRHQGQVSRHCQPFAIGSGVQATTLVSLPVFAFAGLYTVVVI